MSDSTELYYAHMEADRNKAEEAYFAARPSADMEATRIAFRAGFERAYAPLWQEQNRYEPESSTRHQLRIAMSMLRAAQPPGEWRALLMQAYDELPDTSLLREKIMDAVAPVGQVDEHDIEWARTALTKGVGNGDV